MGTWTLRIGGFLLGVVLVTAGRGMRQDPAWSDPLGWTLYLGGLVLVFCLLFVWERTKVTGQE